MYSNSIILLSVKELEIKVYGVHLRDIQIDSEKILGKLFHSIDICTLKNRTVEIITIRLIAA